MVDKINQPMKNILNNTQYFISSIIAVSFGIGLVPTLYDNVFPIIMISLTAQLIISLGRVRLLNVFLEIFLIGAAFLSQIMLLGYIFRFVGIIFSIIEMASFKNGILYKQMEVRTFRTSNKKRRKSPAGAAASINKSKSNVKPKTKIKDAEFKEK